MDFSNLSGYRQWQLLFDQDTAKIWTEEPILELKNLSMILFSIKREMKRIQESIEANVLHLRGNFANKNESGCQNQPKDEYFSKSSNKTWSLSSTPNELLDSKDCSVTISDDEVVNVQGNTNSPEIKKKCRYREFKKERTRKRKLERSLDATESLLVVPKPLSECNIQETTAASPNFWTSSSYRENDKSVHTPLNTDNEFDFTIVQATPVSGDDKTGRKGKAALFNLKPKPRKCKNSTLTQMFIKEHRTKTHRKNVGTGSDSALVQTINNKSEKDSVLSITNMVNYLNENVSQESTKDISLNSAILEESSNENQGLNLSKGLNEFLAKAQNVPNQLEAEAVVRGKARKKLPGWSCKDCENFYLNQGLRPDEILALNKCSKHRGHYRPREDTLPGFWDMNVATQDSDDT